MAISWNDRFATGEYVFGRDAAQFLPARRSLFEPGKRALCVADGEGRNSVWLAEQGLEVVAFDASENAVAKARRLADERGASITATVADIAFATSALTGRNLKIETDHSFDTPKLGVVRSHNWSDADPDYRTQFEALLRSLSTFGVELIDIQPSDNYIAASHAHQIIQDYEARQALAWEHTNHPDKMSDVLRQTLDFAATIKPSDYDDARVAADLALSEMNEHFEEIDAFISLSTPGPAPHGLASTGSPIFNRIWSLFGLPCVNVPGLMSPTGLPLGVQIIGPYLADHDTLQIAHWLEGAIKRHLDR